MKGQTFSSDAYCFINASFIYLTASRILVKQKSRDNLQCTSTKSHQFLHNKHLVQKTITLLKSSFCLSFKATDCLL